MSSQTVEEGAKEVRLQRFRDKLSRAVADHINERRNVLVHAEMGLGKTYTAGRISAWVAGKPITVYTKLWDTREQIRKYAIEEAGLDESDIKTLPTLDRHCECFATGENDEPEHPDVYRTLVQSRDQGATASVIHESEKHLPCQIDGRCEYTRQSDFEAEDYQLIIGSPQHAYVDAYNENRWVLVDEDAAESFETRLDATQVNRAVNWYLEFDDDIDVANKRELMALSITDQIEVLEYITKQDMFDPKLGMNTGGGRADSRAIIRALLDHKALPESGFERSEFEDDEGVTVTIVRDVNEDEEITIRQPPLFRDRNGIVALDGTPHKEMWRNRLDIDLDYDKILDDDETEEYITEALNYKIYQTSTAMNPYSSGEHVQLSQVYALLESIAEKHGQKIPLTTSLRARSKLRHFKPNVYEELVLDDRLYFNNLRSHSEYEDYELNLIAGCKHPGDREVQRLAALDGHDVGKREGRGVDTDYGEPGNSYFEYVCHNEVAQAIFRSGRGEEANGSVSYVHTAMIPGWIPIQDTINGRIRVRTDKEHLTIKALQGEGMAPTSVLAQKTGVTERQTRRHLNNLSIEGYVEKESHRGRSMWIDDGLEDVLWWGEVDLPE